MIELFEGNDFTGGSMTTQHLGEVDERTDWVCTTFASMGRFMDQKSLRYTYAPCASQIPIPQ